MQFSRSFTILSLALFCISGIAFAAVNYGEYFPNWSAVLQSQSNWWASPILSVGGGVKDIMTPVGCKTITNTNNNIAFIPTRTTGEYNSFTTGKPANLTISTPAPTIVNFLSSDALGTNGTGLTASPGIPPSWVTWFAITNSSNQFSWELAKWLSLWYITLAERNAAYTAANTLYLAGVAGSLTAYTAYPFSAWPVTWNVVFYPDLYGYWYNETQIDAHISLTCPAPLCELPPCSSPACSTWNGSPTAFRQTYVKSASNCAFSCTNGYSGNYCELPPLLACPATIYMPWAQTNSQYLNTSPPSPYDLLPNGHPWCYYYALNWDTFHTSWDRVTWTIYNNSKCGAPYNYYRAINFTDCP